MKVSAAILAGGHAVRFGGQDKSALEVEGRTVLDRQVDALSQVAGEIWLVGRTSAPPGVTAIADRTENRGPLGGLEAALSAATGDVTLVLACDIPYPSPAFLSFLAELARDVDAVVPRTERGYHPLCAAYTPGALEPAARRVAAGRLRMRDLLDDLRLRVVTEEEIDRFGDRHRLLANVNTPADYTRLVTRLEAHHHHEL
jgi:molybdopterin-guanine dinucleotide biosynthesis protein A